MQPSTKTLIQYLTELAEKKPDFPLYCQEGHRVLTASETLDRTGNYADRLTRAGIRPGTLLVLRAEKTVETVLHLYALLKLGAAVILADPHETKESIFRKDLYGQAEWYLTGEQGEWELFPSGKKPGEASFPFAGTGQGFPSQASGYPEEERDSRRPCILIHTSGSTGESRLVVLSQYNIINNLTDAASFGDYREGDRALGLLPLTHIFGILLLFGSVILSYGIVFPERMDPDSLLSCMETCRISRINCVPTLLLAMAAKSGKYDLSALRVGFLGGSPCSPEQFRFLEKTFGMTLLPGYGMSECPSISLGSVTDSEEERCTTVGRCYQMGQIRIKDREGRVLPCGQTGEICVSSPSRMIGYYQNEKASAEAVDSDGFLHTGDLGFLDEKGFLHLTGRIKDIIIRNGVNISSRRIEEALLSVPGVWEAAVVSVEDEKTGEIPAAVYTGTEEPSVVLSALAERLPKNELPCQIRKLGAIPHTSSGKADKTAVRKLFPI